MISVDAFPDRPLRGTVGEVTAINTPLNASDVRVYYANVEIDQGFDDLRPGLSAEVTFNIDSRPDVTRVPLESVRWVGDKAYVALYDRASAEAGDQQAWRWRPIELGLSDIAIRRGRQRPASRRSDRVHSRGRCPLPTPATIDPPRDERAGLDHAETRE